jgi:hypothetical protein
LSEINDLIWLELRPKVLGDFKRERQSQKDKKKWSAARQIAVTRATGRSCMILSVPPLVQRA